jgi:Tol biopolymer transport system component
MISPDGKHIVYVSGSGEQARVWIQDLDQFEPREVNRSAGANAYTFWSPDSKQVVFAVSNRLWRAPAVGARP